MKEFAPKVLKYTQAHPQRLLNAFNDFLDLDLAQIPLIIKQAFAEVSAVAGEKVFLQYYDIKKLKAASGAENELISASEQLADYASDIISKNFIELESMRNPLQAEVLNINGDPDSLKTMINELDNSFDISCLSFFANYTPFKLNDLVGSYISQYTSEKL
jgi:hypothetical protein